MNATQRMMNERINWGGFMLTRAEAAQHMQHEGFGAREIGGIGGPFARPALEPEVCAAWWPEMVGLEKLLARE